MEYKQCGSHKYAVYSKGRRMNAGRVISDKYNIFDVFSLSITNILYGPLSYTISNPYHASTERNYVGSARLCHI